MKKDYISILANLKETNLKAQNPNDRILLIDGLNTFIRAYTVNPSMNDDGIHIGGISGFLLSIGYAIKNIKPTRVIICFDGKGGSAKRRKIFPNYKANRRVSQRITRYNSILSRDDERVAMGQQLYRLMDYLDKLPLTVLATENIEADDAIAYISQQVYPKSHFYIMSSDKDFLQLVSDRVQIWSPTKKKFYFKETILEDFEVPYHNFLTYRLMKGDISDNIPGIKGVGIKTLKKVMPMLFGDETLSISEIIKHAKENIDDKKIYKTISESEELLKLNYELMQLHDVDIHGSAKSSIMDIVRNPIQRLIKYKFQKMMLEDKLNVSIKNPDLWLRTVFNILDAMAERSNKNDR